MTTMHEPKTNVTDFIWMDMNKLNGNENSVGTHWLILILYS